MRFPSWIFLLSLALSGTAQECSPLHVISSRATGEAPQNVNSSDPQAWQSAASRASGKGFGNAGYELYSQLKTLIPGTTGHAVAYAANMAGCASENPGIADVVNELTTMSKKCPNQKYVLTGLSQGGVVTVRSINATSPELLSRIVAVALFMSPKCPTVVKDKCKSYCNNDIICTGTGGGRAEGTCVKSVVPRRRETRAEILGHDFAGVIPEAFEDTQVLPRAEPTQCSGTFAESGSQPGGYSYYIKAATCFVYDKFQAAQGTSM